MCVLRTGAAWRKPARSRRSNRSARRYAVTPRGNYAAYPVTSAVIEGGNVGIGLIRKRARGLLDTEHFKLKIRQPNRPDTAEPFYPLPRPSCP